MSKKLPSGYEAMRRQQWSADRIQFERAAMPAPDDSTAELRSLHTERILFKLAGEPTLTTLLKPDAMLTVAPVVSLEEAAALRAKLEANLPEHYRWFTSIEATVLAGYMTEINQFRAEYMHLHKKNPSGGRVYRHFRQLLERADNADTTAHERVVVLEVFLGGSLSDDETNQLPF